MKVQERYEEVMATLEQLRELNERVPVIVEGLEDRRALRALGLQGEILALNVGSSVFGFCEEVSRNHREAIILTDWDHRGGSLCRMLREGLAANGVRYNDEVRARFTLLSRKEIKDVQGLAGYVDRLELLARQTLPVEKKGVQLRERRARRIEGAKGRRGPIG